MYTFLLIFHALISLGLIAVILLQAGRGGGLVESMGGGGSSESLLGTQAPKILKKATTVAAVLFIVNSLVLGMITARRSRSLMERMPFEQIPGQQEALPLMDPSVAEDPLPEEIPAPDADPIPVPDAQPVGPLIPEESIDVEED